MVIPYYYYFFNISHCLHMQNNKKETKTIKLIVQNKIEIKVFYFVKRKLIKPSNYLFKKCLTLHIL